MGKLNPYAKAIAAGLMAGVVMYFKVRSGGVTADEWADIITATAGAAGITWAVPNTDQPTKP